MTFATFEEELDKKQLIKGLVYFKQGSISEFKEGRTGNWRAVVKGSGNYKVHVQIHNGLIVTRSCNCPHNATYCKHIIAVMYAIKNNGALPLPADQHSDGNTESTTHTKRTASRESIAALIDKEPADALRQFVIQHAASDPRFSNLLQAYFSDKLGENNTRVYAKIIRRAIDSVFDNHDYFTSYNIKQITGPVNVLMYKANEAFTNKDYATVADIALAVIENIHDVIDYMGEFSVGDEYIINGMDLLKKLCDEPIPLELKKRLYTESDQGAKSHKYTMHGYDDHWREVLVKAAYDDATKNQVSQYLDGSLAEKKAAEREALIKKLQSAIKKNSDPDENTALVTLAEIFKEEKYWERLLALLQKNARLDLVESYHKYLLRKYPADMLKVYQQAIVDYARANTGRRNYEIVREALTKMQQWKGGKVLVKQLVKQFTVEFKTRKAMTEELEKIAL